MAPKKIYFNNKYKSNINFQLICRARIRIREVLNTKPESIPIKKI